MFSPVAPWSLGKFIALVAGIFAGFVLLLALMPIHMAITPVWVLVFVIAALLAICLL